LFWFSVTLEAEMAHPLTQSDRDLVLSLRKRGTLRDIAQEKIPPLAFVWSCGDGDRFEQLEYLFSLMRGKGGKRTIKPHLFTWNGGPLVLAADSPLEDGRKFAFRQFLAATALKPHIRACIMQGHLICGAADSAELDILSTLRILKQSFLELKRFIDKRSLTQIVFMVCLVHGDYGDGTMRTYEFNIDDFE